MLLLGVPNFENHWPETGSVNREFGLERQGNDCGYYFYLALHRSYIEL